MDWWNVLLLAAIGWIIQRVWVSRDLHSDSLDGPTHKNSDDRDPSSEFTLCTGPPGLKVAFSHGSVASTCEEFCEKQWGSDCVAACDTNAKSRCSCLESSNASVHCGRPMKSKLCTCEASLHVDVNAARESLHLRGYWRSDNFYGRGRDEVVFVDTHDAGRTWVATKVVGDFNVPAGVQSWMTMEGVSTSSGAAAVAVGTEVDILVQGRPDPDSMPDKFVLLSLALHVRSAFHLEVVDPVTGQKRGDFWRQSQEEESGKEADSGDAGIGATSAAVSGTSDSSTASTLVIEPLQWSENGHWYGVGVLGAGTGGDAVTFVDAAIEAHRLGGYLATLHSLEENEFVFQLSLEAAALYNPPTHDDDGSVECWSSVEGGRSSLPRVNRGGTTSSMPPRATQAGGQVWAMNGGGFCIGPFIGLQRDYNQREFWKSASSDHSKGWIWATKDEPLRWTNWDAGQPSNSGAGEGCVVMMGKNSASPRWNDYACA